VRLWGGLLVISRPLLVAAAGAHRRLFCVCVFGRSPLGKGSCAGEFFFYLASLRLDNTEPSEEIMNIILNAQPYDVSATGFYFSKASEYGIAAMSNRNDQGDPVEEYEIQFIDGEDIDCELAKAIGLSQGNFAVFLELADTWDDWEKVNAIIAVSECGYEFDPQADPEDYDIDLYEVGR
jgi:hypothetical protein